MCDISKLTFLSTIFKEVIRKSITEESCLRKNLLAQKEKKYQHNLTHLKW